MSMVKQVDSGKREHNGGHEWAKADVTGLGRQTGTTGRRCAHCRKMLTARSRRLPPVGNDSGGCGSGVGGEG